MPSEYTVKSGDTLWGIAKQHQVSFQELKKANPQIKPPYQIHPGDKIAIPDKQSGNKEVSGDSEKCEKTSCIKIILTHEYGYFYVGEPCRIKQEKTLIRQGKLDEKGSFLLERICSGLYSVEFPKFDPENISSEKINESSVEDQVECGTMVRKNLSEFNKPLELRIFSGKTHIITVQVKRELIIIVGAEDYYDDKPANKTIFMAQAVRYLKKHHSVFDLTTIFYFRGTNTSAQVTAFEKAVQANGGTVKEASSWENIADHINQTQVRVNGKYFIKKVQVINFFAHGDPGQIWLYSKEEIFFGEKEVKLIKANVAFARTGGRYPDIHITSWACQTGNAAKQPTVNENGTVTHQPTIDENMAESLAQTIADFLKIKVYASARKTDYEKTWDTGIRGWYDDRTGTRILIDEAIWEKEGADNPVQSGKSNSGSVKMPQGMFSFNPNQRKDYQIISLDY